MLGLHCCAWAFSGCSKQGIPCNCGVQASHCGGFSCCGGQVLRYTGFSSCGSRALAGRLSSMAHTLGCPVPRGLFPDQELNLCPPNCKVDSLPLDHQGNSFFFFLNFFLAPGFSLGSGYIWWSYLSSFLIY